MVTPCTIAPSSEQGEDVWRGHWETWPDDSPMWTEFSCFISQCEARGFLCSPSWFVSALQPAKHSFGGLPGKDQHELCFPLLVISPIKEKHPHVKKFAVRTQNGGFFSVLLLEASVNAGQNNAGLSPLAYLGISFFLLISEALWNCRWDQALLSFPDSWLPFGGAYTEAVLAKWHHVSTFYLLSCFLYGGVFCMFT